METETWIRNSLTVEAVKINAENIDDVCAWSGFALRNFEIDTNRDYWVVCDGSEFEFVSDDMFTSTHQRFEADPDKYTAVLELLWEAFPSETHLTVAYHDDHLEKYARKICDIT